MPYFLDGNNLIGRARRTARPTEADRAALVAEALKLPEKFVEGFGVFVLLAHGFILTGMLWGAALAFVIDKRIGAGAVVLGISSVLSLFGFIHSVLPTGGIYLPWSAALVGSNVPYHWAAGYAAWAILLLILGRKPQSA